MSLSISFIACFNSYATLCIALLLASSLLSLPSRNRKNASEAFLGIETDISLVISGE
jgi:hypothetical protein